MYNKTTSNFKKIHVNAHVCTGVGLRGRGPLKGPAVNQFNDCHMGVMGEVMFAVNIRETHSCFVLQHILCCQTSKANFEAVVSAFIK